MTLINGNRTEWSPIRFVIIRVITKSDDRVAGVRFVYHEYDYRLYSTVNKITQFWLVESSTINPKLYSVGVPIKFPWKRRNFVECTINKKSHDLVQFMNNRYSWFWKFSNCTSLFKLHSPKGSCNFENFQNHSYLLITDCTRGRAISHTKHKNYNFLACDWFKNVLFSTNSLAKLLSDSLLLDSVLSDSLISQSHSKM